MIIMMDMIMVIIMMMKKKKLHSVIQKNDNPNQIDFITRVSYIKLTLTLNKLKVIIDMSTYEIKL